MGVAVEWVWVSLFRIDVLDQYGKASCKIAAALYDSCSTCMLVHKVGIRENKENNLQWDFFFSAGHYHMGEAEKANPSLSDCNLASIGTHQTFNTYHSTMST